MLCLLAFALFWITPDTVRADNYNSVSLSTDDIWVSGSIDQEGSYGSDYKRIKKGTYYFRVRAYVGNTKHTSTWSKARKYTVKQ